MPDKITVLYLPPYSPELNPVERLWGYLCSHHLSNRAYDGYAHLLAVSAPSMATPHPRPPPIGLPLHVPDARVG